MVRSDSDHKKTKMSRESSERNGAGGTTHDFDPRVSEGFRVSLVGHDCRLFSIWLWWDCADLSHPTGSSRLSCGWHWRHNAGLMSSSPQMVFAQNGLHRPTEGQARLRAPPRERSPTIVGCPDHGLDKPRSDEDVSVIRRFPGPFRAPSCIDLVYPGRRSKTSLPWADFRCR